MEVSEILEMLECKIKEEAENEITTEKVYDEIGVVFARSIKTPYSAITTAGGKLGICFGLNDPENEVELDDVATIDFVDLIKRETAEFGYNKDKIKQLLLDVVKDMDSW